MNENRDYVNEAWRAPRASSYKDATQAELTGVVWRASTDTH